MRSRALAIAAGAWVALLSLAAGDLEAAEVPGVPEGAQISLLVVDVATGAREQAINPDHLVTPASTLKLVTALAASLALGPDWRYRTTLWGPASAGSGTPPDNATDYILEFTGAPDLTTGDLVRLFEELAREGSSVLPGDLILDRSAYAGYDRGKGWAWDDLGVCFAAPPSALIIDGNCAEARIYTPRVGGHDRVWPERVDRIQVGGSVEVVPWSRYRGGWCGLELERGPGNRYTLGGCAPPRDKPWRLRFAVNDVARWGEALVAEALDTAGIRVDGAIRVEPADRTGYRPVATVTSAPLEELIDGMLKDSDNLTADSLLRTLGRVHFERPGTFANGAAALRTLLATRAGIDLRRAAIVDGSGLSRYNLLSAEHLAEVLAYIARHEATDHLIEALPQSGRDGTLRYRYSLRSDPLRGRIRAKTGSLRHIRQLAGFMETESDGLKAFVLLMRGLSTDSDAPEGPGRTRDIAVFERRLLTALFEDTTRALTRLTCPTVDGARCATGR